MAGVIQWSWFFFGVSLVDCFGHHSGGGLWSRSWGGRRPGHGGSFFGSSHEQAITGNKVEQCPCVKRPGSDSCITYDFRYQAATLAEAMLNFPDLVVEDASVDFSEPSRAVAGNSTMDCKDDQCKICTYFMIQHLKYMKVVLEEEANQMMKDIGLQDVNVQILLRTEEDRQKLRETCHRYRFMSGNHPMRAQERRGKRQTTLGTRHMINCVGRGDADTLRPDLLHLCNMCWAWRQLPSDYFPNFVNELICSDDRRCLSGSGECNQGTRNLNVLRNYGTEAAPSWVPVAISSGNCCSCKLQYNSPYRGLVTGK